MEKLTDSSPMPYGKHINEKMANVPGKYLLWLNDKIHEKSKLRWSINEKMVSAYIEYNLEKIKKE